MRNQAINLPMNEWAMAYAMGCSRDPVSAALLVLSFFFFFLSLLSLSDRFSGPAWVDWIKYI